MGAGWEERPAACRVKVSRWFQAGEVLRRLACRVAGHRMGGWSGTSCLDVQARRCHRCGGVELARPGGLPPLPDGWDVERDRPRAIVVRDASNGRA